jgi:hypothetical protein
MEFNEDQEYVYECFYELRSQVNELYHEVLGLPQEKENIIQTFFELLSEFENDKMGEIIDELICQLKETPDIHSGLYCCICRMLSQK